MNRIKKAMRYLNNIAAIKSRPGLYWRGAIIVSVAFVAFSSFVYAIWQPIPEKGTGFCPDNQWVEVVRRAGPSGHVDSMDCASSRGLPYGSGVEWPHLPEPGKGEGVCSQGYFISAFSRFGPSNHVDDLWCRQYYNSTEYDATTPDIAIPEEDGGIPGIGSCPPGWFISYARRQGPNEHFTVIRCSKPNPRPIGNHEAANCNFTSGWAIDQDTDDPIDVHIYDGPLSGGNILAVVKADKPRPDVGSVYGSQYNNSGFIWNIPASLKDNQLHDLYVYAINASGGMNPLIGNSPLAVQCAPENGAIMGMTLNANNMLQGVAAKVIIDSTVINTGTGSYSGKFDNVDYSYALSLGVGFHAVTVEIPSGYSKAEYNMCIPVPIGTDLTGCHDSQAWVESTTIAPNVQSGKVTELWWRFTPSGGSGGGATSPSSVSASGGVCPLNTLINVSWSGGGPNYDVQRRNITSNGPWVGIRSNYSSTSINNTIPIAGDTYRYRVRGTDGSSSSSWRISNAIATEAACAVNHRPVVTADYPPHDPLGAAPIDASSPVRFKWTFSDSDGDSQRAYIMRLIKPDYVPPGRSAGYCEDRLNSTLCQNDVIDFPHTNGDNDRSVVSSLDFRDIQLEPNTRYKWQVRVRDDSSLGSKWSQWSSINEFWTALPPTCPNGIVDPGEQCDDGNLDNTDECNDACQFTYCGDSIVQQPNGLGLIEECDGGAGCSGCKSIAVQCEITNINPPSGSALSLRTNGSANITAYPDTSLNHNYIWFTDNPSVVSLSSRIFGSSGPDTAVVKGIQSGSAAVYIKDLTANDICPLSVNVNVSKFRFFPKWREVHPR